MLGISVVILIISMLITSALGGGVEFGELHIVLAKAIPLLLVIALLEFVPFPYGAYWLFPSGGSGLCCCFVSISWRCARWS
jgi:hypothetical protein